MNTALVRFFKQQTEASLKNRVKGLAEYLGTPDRPVTPEELAEMWEHLTRSEEIMWIDFEWWAE